MNLRSILTQSSKPIHPVYRYGMLVIILLLLVQDVRWYLTLPPTYPYDPYGGLIGVLMLLFLHLAFAFQWRRSVAVALWILAVGWLLFAFFYISYWSDVLYPIHMPGTN